MQKLEIAAGLSNPATPDEDLAASKETLREEHKGNMENLRSE